MQQHRLLLINWQVLPGIRVIHHVGVHSELAKSSGHPMTKFQKFGKDYGEEPSRAFLKARNGSKTDSHP